VELSIVTTLYCSAPHVEEFYARVCAAADEITDDYEIIFVNDGSPDDSLEIALSLYARDRRVKVLDLSRNFGHHKAIMTGLAHAKGSLVFLIDIDLEEKPELLGRFHGELQATGADVIYGVQETRKGRFVERFTGSLFYALFNSLSDCEVPRNLLTARLMTRRYVAGLVQHRDREVFLGGLFAITGFKQVPVAVAKGHRGESTYGVGRKVALLVNSVTSFSNKPLVLMFYLGLAIVVASGLAGLYLVANRLLFGVLLTGWPSLIVSLWFLGGLTIFCLGVIGVYLSKIFMETKERPYTLIRATYDHGAPVGAGLPDGARRTKAAVAGEAHVLPGGRSGGGPRW
jgi:putative glycosyltransferase